MKTIISLKRLTTLLLVIFVCSCYSFGAVYKLTWVETSPGLYPRRTQFTYNSSNPTRLTVVATNTKNDKVSYSLDISGVKAQIIDKTYLKKKNYLSGLSSQVRDAENGILFSKDGKDLCVLFYSTPMGTESERSRELVMFYRGKETGKSPREVNVLCPAGTVQEHPDMKVYNALLAEVAGSSSANSSVQKPATATQQKPAQTTQTTQTQLVASIPYIQALPPERGQSNIYVNYTLKSNSNNLRRRLFIWDINGGKFLLNPSTGQQLMTEKTGIVDGEKQQLVFDISKLPAASPSKPFLFTICVYINDPTLQKELTNKFVGVYKWDGSKITYNPSN